MIYISAQPDQFYFLWQLKLQLFNFNRLGIPRQKIHVLIGYDPIIGLSDFFKKFIAHNNYACFYAYEDTRENCLYPSSIRPHLIKKHLKKYPYLEKECLFYHDSDILFRKLPQLSSLEHDPICYASDTRTYLDCNYIINNSSLSIFSEMCKIVGICPDVVLQNNENVGGAQYLLKETSVAFWEKIERDCESLYSFLKDKIVKKGIFKRGDNKHYPLDFWVTDMWVLWWNLLFFNKEFKVSKELDFCWATSSIEKWGSCNILHYTGIEDVMNKNFFVKIKYKVSEPFYDDFSQISNSTCSSVVVNLINDYRKDLEKNRIHIDDVSVVIRVTKQSIENIITLIRYIKKDIDIEILLVGSDVSLVSQHEFLQNFRILCSDTHVFIDNIKKYVKTPYVVIYSEEIIFLNENLLDAINSIRNKKYKIIQCNGNEWKFDILSKFLFSKLLDSEFLKVNRQKMRNISNSKEENSLTLLALSDTDKNDIISCDYDCFVF